MHLRSLPFDSPATLFGSILCVPSSLCESLYQSERPSPLETSLPTLCGHTIASCREYIPRWHRNVRDAHIMYQVANFESRRNYITQQTEADVIAHLIVL